MVYFKELIAFWTLVAAAVAQYTPYQPAYSPAPYQHKKVNLHKLCSWNVIEYDYPSLRDDTWDACKVDAGRNYIPENNIPTGIGFSEDRRVFVSLAGKRSGVYATLAYFRLDDIKDGRCPPLKAYPSDSDNSLDAQCCTDRNLINIDRFSIDACNRLWAVDRQALNLNDKDWELGSPRLMIFNLNNDQIDREIPIPSDYYFRYQLGLDTVIINVDPKDCGNAFGYIVDTWNGCIIVYSYKQNKFWRVCSPEFSNDAKYSKFSIKTRKNKDVTYYRKENIYDCTRNIKTQHLICHSCASLDEWTIPFAELDNEEIARCSPNSLNVKFLGQKCKNCQTGSHVMNQDNHVVWGVQELNYGIGCWNRENPLNPEAVQLVASDPQKLPYVCDLGVTKVDLSRFVYPQSYNQQYSTPETYIAVLSNNRIGIEEHGFDHDEENFGIYFIKESEALYAYPQCLPQQYSKPAPYQPVPYQPAPYQPAPYQPAPYQPAPYKAPPVYVPPPTPVPYKAPPVYQPAAPVYKPAPVYQPSAPVYNPPNYRSKKSASEESTDAVDESK